MVLIGLVLLPFTLGFSLFFILGGASGFYGKHNLGAQRASRPSHPPVIQGLISSLNANGQPDGPTSGR